MKQRWFRQNGVALFSALLSSSCCVIQLALNLFSVSCAGFAIFTPYRQYLVALTMVLSISSLVTSGFTKRSALNFAVCIMLMVSPEIVNYINQFGYALSQANQDTHYLIGIDGMSCLACANRIRRTLESAMDIREAKIFFENASAIVRMSPQGDGGRVVDTIHHIQDKYRAKILESW
jgi:copper chaperone CopZ